MPGAVDLAATACHIPRMCEVDIHIVARQTATANGGMPGIRAR
jgi:hypothetical protein